MWLQVLLFLYTPKLQAQEINTEHYFYTNSSEVPVLTGLVGYTTRQNWYWEARYNYEDFNSQSFHIGKTFSYEGKTYYEFTPMVGIITGNFRGAAIGIKLEIEHKHFVVYSQTQYTISKDDKSLNYLYNWSEAAYKITPWFFAGAAVQQTRFQPTERMQPGLMIDFKIKNLVLPVYFFDITSKERFLVLGVNWKWELTKKHDVKASN